MKTSTLGKAAAGVLAAVVLLTAAERQAEAAEVSLTADLASAYVFRGATFNDGAVLQPGLEVAGFPLPEGSGALALGVWGNLDLDDYGDTLESGQFSEIDIYLSYALPVDAFDASLGYTEYTYPSGGGDADRELAAGVGFALPLSPSLDIAYGVDGGIDKTLYVEAGVGHEVALSECLALELGATASYLDPDGGESGFSHFTASAGLSYAMVSASITYVGQIDDDVLPDVEDGGAYDVEVYGMLGVGYTF
ncbi:MAG: hypothetical protein JW951_09405 [Lentisphaerae bacterium]|nr:hypothetical protein [Lentisphaerota bacterium]